MENDSITIIFEDFYKRLTQTLEFEETIKNSYEINQKLSKNILAFLFLLYKEDIIHFLDETKYNAEIEYLPLLEKMKNGR